MLLDGTFAAIPQLLDEARRVIVNIVRVAGLFVAKTVYAAIIAVSVATAGIAYPFYPRHLTIISTLTIGVPGFFLTLAAGAARARPGFIRQVLAFTIPAGVAAAAAALGSYALARAAAGVSAGAARTAAMLALLAVGLWILGIVADRAACMAHHPGSGDDRRPRAAVHHRPGAGHLRRPASACQRPAPGGRDCADAITGLTVWRHLPLLIPNVPG